MSGTSGSETSIKHRNATGVPIGEASWRRREVKREQRRAQREKKGGKRER
jgi:hypothetical protein